MYRCILTYTHFNEIVIHIREKDIRANKSEKAFYDNRKNRQGTVCAVVIICKYNKIGAKVCAQPYKAQHGTSCVLISHFFVTFRNCTK